MADPVLSYCTIPQLTRWGVQASAIKKIPVDVQQEAIDGASRQIDSYLRSHFKLPLLQVGDDVARACAILAAYDLLAVRGFSPEGDADKVLLIRYEQAIDWLKLVAAGRAHPDVTDSASGAEPGKPATGPRVTTATSRGWSNRGTNEPGGGFVID